MDLPREEETKASTITEVEQETKITKEPLLEDLPRLEDLLKSEQEIKPARELKGLEQVKDETLSENKVFKKKEDEKRAFVKRRLKVLTGVYIAVASLLFSFVGINAVTQALLTRDINSNANTIQSKSEQVVIYENMPGGDPVPGGDPFTVTLNEPRDYNDDTKELTFMDKLTILFRNLFS